MRIDSAPKIKATAIRRVLCSFSHGQRQHISEALPCAVAIREDSWPGYDFATVLRKLSIEWEKEAAK
jgi:hypothetical protein